MSLVFARRRAEAARKAAAARPPEPEPVESDDSSAARSKPLTPAQLRQKERAEAQRTG